MSSSSAEVSPIGPNVSIVTGSETARGAWDSGVEVIVGESEASPAAVCER